MKTVRYEKLRAAVMLCIAANRDDLPPYDVRNIKQKGCAKSKFLQRYNSSGPTTEVMEGWLGRVWESRPAALPKPRSMLVMGAFCGPLSGRMRNRLKNQNTDLVIIPSGTTRWQVNYNHLMCHLVAK
jgi:hypothetical protein